MRVCFDLGNSRAKWMVRDAQGRARVGALAHGDAGFAQALAVQLRELPAADRVLVASVAGAPALAVVQDVVRMIWNVPVTRLQAQSEQCGVRNAYRQPAQMGVDRWLAMIGAWSRWRRPVCVVDAGTAATVDVVAADGRHLGGLIAPGVELARSLLESATAGIRASARAPAAALGDSTAACVANGSLLGVLGLVRMALDIMDSACGDAGMLVVTGGAAQELLPHLPEHAEHLPELVFEGMELVDKEARP